ncbi:MAG: hypothetical protein WBO28_07605 [Flavobacteriales bacterium]
MLRHRDTYKLQILCEPNAQTHDALTAILGVEPSEPFPKRQNWIYRVQEGPGEPYYDFINEFLNLLEGKYEAIAKLGIDRSDITIWRDYEFDGQCNMEYDPERMKRLGDNGITLCISCWDISAES